MQAIAIFRDKFGLSRDNFRCVNLASIYGGGSRRNYFGVDQQIPPLGLGF